jgi:hypothetical protein
MAATRSTDEAPHSGRPPWSITTERIPRQADGHTMRQERATMSMVTCSLWLPVGRANFYSRTSDSDLITSAAEGLSQGESKRLADETYIPRLRSSVVRRMLEVLPRSFGYGLVGECVFSDEVDEVARPVAIVMRLRPASPTGLVAEAVEANEQLVRAGVGEVILSVDEHGSYTFTASYDGGQGDGEDRRAAARKALAGHVIGVFGGEFTVDRLSEPASRTFNEGAAAVRRYNGLDSGTLDPVPRPLGVLSFFQLNVLVEGLCNQALLPAVFFEHYDFVRDWLARNRSRTTILTTLGQIIQALLVDADATDLTGQVTALHRFLAVSRGSLQRIKRSIESVRRAMLDEMMRMLHRQARLVQLVLGAVSYERTPELAGTPTESQMRGYVMLVAVKLPLIVNIGDAATLAVEHLGQLVEEAHAGDQTLVDNLGRDMRHWNALLKGLRANVRGLERAVETDWQERLLHEQEQTRSEQEALAEIQRSRRGHADGRRSSESVATAIALVIAALTFLLTLRTAHIGDVTTASVGELVARFWPLAPLAIGVYLAAPAVALARRLRSERSASSDRYGFEFAFRFGEKTTAQKVYGYLAGPSRQTIRTSSFGRIRLRRLGGWRIERISQDTTLAKIHSLASVRVSRFRYARCEIVTDVMARKIADGEQFRLRQCRMFGDSPKVLPPERINDLVRELLTRVCGPLAADDDLNLSEVLSLTRQICTGA